MGEVYELNSKTLKAGQVSSTSFLSASLGAPLHGLSPTLSRVSPTAGAATGLFTLVCSVSSRQPEPAQYMFELNLIASGELEDVCAEDTNNSPQYDNQIVSPDVRQCNTIRDQKI